MSWYESISPHNYNLAMLGGLFCTFGKAFLGASAL